MNQNNKDWYQLDFQNVEKEWKTNIDKDLTEKEASKRLEQYGKTSFQNQSKKNDYCFWKSNFKTTCSDFNHYRNYFYIYKRNWIIRTKNMGFAGSTVLRNLGSCTVIATDKTGTLSLNEQIILTSSGKTHIISGQVCNGNGRILNQNEEKRNLITIGVLNNEADLYQKHRIYFSLYYD